MRFFLYKFWVCIFFFITKVKVRSTFLYFFTSSPQLYIKEIFFLSSFSHLKISWLISQMSSCSPLPNRLHQTCFHDHSYFQTLFQTDENNCCFQIIQSMNPLITHLSQKGDFFIEKKKNLTIQGCVISFNSFE